VSFGKRDAAEGSHPPLDFEGVYREHAERVARWAARLGGPEIDVDDVVQEVFVAVHKQLAAFRGESQVATWLYRITANQVGERRRRDRIRRWLGGSATDVGGKLPSPGLSPVEALERREASQRVYKILDQMNERYRTLMILFEIEKLSGQEIANLTGMSLDSVWVGLHRARAQFVKRLEREEARS
jgi:RNA polymerase sigma-70 factor (ECF subfamily)